MFRLLQHPFLVGSVAMLWGYGTSALKQAPRYADPEFRRFLRRYQYACLRYGKGTATRKLNDAQAGVWAARTAAVASRGGMNESRRVS
jgi:hypothetical protein